jgi:opacity protein-like surface antigen
MTANQTTALALSALCVILIQSSALADPYEDSEDDYVDDHYVASGPRTEFSITGGIAPPTGSLTDYHQMGFSIGGGVSYHVTPHLAINVISVGYDRFGLDENQFQDDTGLESSGASISMLSVMGGIRARFIPEGFSPFVAADAGLVHASVDDLTVDGSTTFSGTSENDFGMSLGGGIEGPMNSTSSVFTEVRVNMAFTEGETSTYVPVRAGMRFHF